MEVEGNHMAEYASNVPISRPIDPGWKSAWDMNGIQWSHEFGMFYAPTDEFIPLRKPPPKLET